MSHRSADDDSVPLVDATDATGLEREAAAAATWAMSAYDRAAAAHEHAAVSHSRVAELAQRDGDRARASLHRRRAAAARVAADAARDAKMRCAPSTEELVALGVPITLRDGSHVRIRPGQIGDRELLLRGFERLSPESRYRRFLAPMPELSNAMIAYLTEVDHHDHEAMIAIDERTGEGVGVARYVRSRERHEVAEVAVTVVDDWQGEGWARCCWRS